MWSSEVTNMIITGIWETLYMTLVSTLVGYVIYSLGETVSVTPLIGPGKWVLIDFWATWCGPCRMQGPAVEKLAEEGYNVGKINVDDEGELAERYHVMNIPTLIIFKNGEEKERMVGVQSKDLLESKLKALA